METTRIEVYIITSWISIVLGTINFIFLKENNDWLKNISAVSLVVMNIFEKNED